ncbi:MAG: prephenate dehydrogenase [Anaerolineaceae bacterium]|nr:prephenate dehydrogenase [Anaerolineaceae bacterium]
MTIQITIIGLRQIGASIGLALKDHQELVTRLGHDRESSIARQAEKLGAVDQVSYNLPASIRQADLVILTEPVDELLETLDIIAPELREGVVVMDTASIKAGLINLVLKKLPPERHYVSLLPAINPAYLEDRAGGIEGAHADLFQKGLVLITNPPGTNAEAIKLAADLTGLLGATPMFIDPAEADGLAAATIQLPLVMAAAFLNATTEQPGWREARKLAGLDYASASTAILNLPESEDLGQSLLLNPDNTIRMIDALSEALADLRQAIADQDKAALTERLDHARKSRALWIKQRNVANWGPESNPQSGGSAGSVFSRWIGIRRPGKERR